jgi:hypothetical protein
MNQNKLKRQYKLSGDLDESDLAAALDESVRAAVALGVHEQELVEQMLVSLRSTISNNVVRMPRKMYDSSAGP